MITMVGCGLRMPCNDITDGDNIAQLYHALGFYRTPPILLGYGPCLVRGVGQGLAILYQLLCFGSSVFPAPLHFQSVPPAGSISMPPIKIALIFQAQFKFHHPYGIFPSPHGQKKLSMAFQN